MALRDKQIDWLRKRRFYSVWELNGTLGAAGVSVDAVTAGITHIEISSFGIVFPEIANTEQTGGAIKIPYDLDPKYDLGFRVHYTADYNAAAPVFTWTMVYGLKKATAFAAAASTLDKVFTAQGLLDANGVATTTDWIPQISPRGIIYASSHKLSHDDINNGRTWLGFVLTLAVTNSPSSVRFMGLEMDYVPQLTVGSGSEVDRPRAYTGKS